MRPSNYPAGICLGQGVPRFKRPPGRDTGRPLARLPAPDLLRFRRKDFRGGPTRDVVGTIHVGPNQTVGPTAWPNRIYANFVAKTARLDAKARSRARAPGGSKCRARGFRAPYRCLSPCDESLLWAGSISTIVHS